MPKDRYVGVAHNDNGKIHIELRDDWDQVDIWVNNHPDTVDREVERKDVRILGWRLK